MTGRCANPRFSRWTVLAPLLIVAVIATACGSSDGTGTGTVATTEATTATSATSVHPSGTEPIVRSSEGPETSSTTSGVTTFESTTETMSVASPQGDFYQPPDPLEVASPGTLIWAERVEGIDLNPPATIWRMLYHSRNGQDQDIAVSGFAVVPTSPAPAGERPVYAWAHGTVGLGDQCAPSHEIRDNLPPYGGQQVERGAVLVATDYEGIGTPGLPTNTDGDGEGRAVLDSIRAVGSLPDVGVIGDVVLAGHSQGGAAVMWASEIAASYAPELDVVGSVALAPGAELPALADAIVASPYKGIVLIGAIGLRTTHPDLDLSRVLTPAAMADLPRVESECVDDTVQRYESLPTSDVVSQAPSSDPELARLLQENSPGSTPIGVPIFLGHGTADEQVPPELSDATRSKVLLIERPSDTAHLRR